jgi:hypothetical protein
LRSQEKTFPLGFGAVEEACAIRLGASGRGEGDSLDSALPYWSRGIAALLSPARAELLDLPKCYHNTCAKAGRDQHEKKVQIDKRAHKLESSQRQRTASTA